MGDWMKLALCAGSFALDVEIGNATIYDILEIARKYCFQGIEIRDDLLGDKENDLNRISKIASTNGMHIIYACKYRFLNADLSLMKESCEKTKERISEAKLLGSNILKLSFGQIDSVNDLSTEHFKLIKDTIKFAESHDIVVCVENADKYLGGRPDTIKKVIDSVASPYFKVNYDCGNFAVWGQDPIDALVLLKDDVHYVHLKDVKREGPAMTHIGDGRIDFKCILHTLERIEYGGYLCFEFPMSIDQLEIIEESINYMKGLTRA